MVGARGFACPERDRMARGDAVLGQHQEQAAEGVIDGVGSLEVLKRAEELGGKAFGVQELLLALGVDEAERRVTLHARDQATAAVGSQLLAVMMALLGRLGGHGVPRSGS